MKRESPERLALALACLLLAACASTANERLVEGPPPAGVSNPDPIQPTNRALFSFNDRLDRHLLEPLAIGWTWITPEYFRTHLDQVFHNLGFPGQLVNNLFQGELKQSGRDVGRFVVNSTAGVAGFFDPASSLGLTTRGEDFGQTLGVWGLGPGAYIVLPFLGSSGGRDLAALPVDFVLNPLSTPLISGRSATLILVSASAVRLVNSRALALDQIRQAREAALDWYLFVRDAYRQQREAAVANDKHTPAAADDSLYELDEDEP